MASTDTPEVADTKQQIRDYCDELTSKGYTPEDIWGIVTCDALGTPGIPDAWFDTLPCAPSNQA